MPLKFKYEATRGGKRSLIRDARPGDYIYVKNDHAGGGKSYSVRVVTNMRAWPSGVLIVECPTTHATWSITQLLASERELYGQQPAGMPNRAAKVRFGDEAEAAALAAQEVADRFVDSDAVDLAQHYKRLARR